MRPFFLTLLATSQLIAADFPTPFNSGNEKDRTPTPVAEALAAIQLPPGFRAQCFASEPMVQNPIACAWDARGRLWIAENYTYADQRTNFDKTLRDRILILEDTDGDGTADKRTVFADDLQNLTSIALGYGGVFVTAAPNLLFIPDRDSDDIPDAARISTTQTSGKDKAPPPAKPAAPAAPAVVKKTAPHHEILLDGFDAWSVRHNFVNGLKWGPDGWLYGRHGIQATSHVGAPGTPAAERVTMNCGIWRFHPVRHTFEVVCWGGTNPWGLDWNAEGEGFFVNSVIGHAYHLIPGAHYERMYGEDPNPHIYQLLPQTADHHHFDTGKGWTASRDGKANDLGGGHAHSGCMIYQGDNWPAEYRGKLFTANLHGHRINSDRIERSGSGYVIKHDTDFAFFGDPWFRGVELTTGPDGSVYILDWCDIGECHENDGVHRTSGRIWKITYGQGKKNAVAERPKIKPTPAPPDPLTPTGRRRICSDLQGRPADEIIPVMHTILLHPDDNADPILPLLYWSTFERLFSEENVITAQASTAAYNGKISLALKFAVRRCTEDLRTKPERVAFFLDRCTAAFEASKAESIVRGLSEGLRGITKATVPATWPAFAAKASAIPALADEIRELNVIFGDGRALDEIRAVALDKNAHIASRRQAVQTLVQSKPADLRATLEKLVGDNDLLAATLQGLATFDDPAAAALIVSNFKRVRADARPGVITALCSRATFAGQLLDAIAAEKITTGELTPYHARQIAALGDAALTAKLGTLWGTIATPADLPKRIAQWRAKLPAADLAKADLTKGRALFSQACGACHKLNGEGGDLAPDLTGSGRSDLGYLLENILAPNAVVPAGYRLNLIELKDRRVLSGFIAGQNDTTLTLRTMTETQTIERASIAKTTLSEQSLMPEGLLNALSPDQVRDLLGYLMKK